MNTFDTLFTLDMKYVPISRMTIAEKCIPDLVGKVTMHICETLKKHSSISVTVNISLDRTMRSFLGIAAHVCNTSEDVYKLDSFHLDCKHFPSRHTGENISLPLMTLQMSMGLQARLITS